jgi:hypothetical protein
MARSFNITEMDKIKELINQLKLYTANNNYNVMDNTNNSSGHLDYNFNKYIENENKIHKNNYINQKKNEKINKEEENFFNLPLTIIYKNFLTTWNNIIIDLINLFSNLETLEKKNNFFDQSFFILKKISFIFFRNDRIIYIGISFIILSFFIYFILVSK